MRHPGARGRKGENGILQPPLRNRTQGIVSILRKPLSSFAAALCVLAFTALVDGCGVVRPSHVELPPVLFEAPLPPSDFTIDAGMLDTWNAVGQILVRTDGVTYRGRAQMLGLYDVEFQGELFLVLTRALLLDSQGQGMSTRVSVALQDGKPDGSAPAIALLGSLQARLPEELRVIAAGKGKRKKH